jgi:hypothetical protein
MQITLEQAHLISGKWVEYWNNDTVEKYLTLYDDEATLVSNVALRLIPNSFGRIAGKTQMLEYWTLVRLNFPQFKFRINRVEIYENKIIAYYESLIDYSKAIAILSINDDLLIKKIEVSYV